MSRHETFERIERVERYARRMDRAFRLPFTNIRLGWDSILGLVPGVGDTLALAPAVWIVNEARNLGAPKSLIVQMAWNVGVDWAIGLLPLIGDIMDIGYKANTRNAALLRKWAEERYRDVGEGSGAAPDYQNAKLA
ncbi:DUF4112 domain-containing protein [Salipiger sp.]|uniref:DUF4112 domain-containing protein n=1 Tax=Salipiger sp. TaxID=2078585 RepID=UPI003A97356E